MAEKKYPQVIFRLDAELEAELQARSEGNLNYAARGLLEAYFYLLRAELSGLPPFSVAELGLLADVTNGLRVEPHTVQLLWASVDDGVRLEGLDKKWGLDGAALVARLRGLSYAQAAALLDALKRWWANPERAVSAEGFAAVGLAARGRRKYSRRSFAQIVHKK